jgi:hypothetical protein
LSVLHGESFPTKVSRLLDDEDEGGVLKATFKTMAVTSNEIYSGCDNPRMSIGTISGEPTGYVEPHNPTDV